MPATADATILNARAMSPAPFACTWMPVPRVPCGFCFTAAVYLSMISVLTFPTVTTTETAVLKIRGAGGSGSRSGVRQCEFALTV